LAGYTSSNGAGGLDFWLLKITLYETDSLSSVPDEDEFSESEVVTSEIDSKDPDELLVTTTVTVTKETPVILTPKTETPVAFVPGFGIIELGLALVCLIFVVRIRHK